jgi:hypothetical protein
MPNVGKMVIKYLKEHGGSTLEEISSGTNIPQHEVFDALNTYIGSNFVAYDASDSHYRVKFVLDPVLPENETAETTVWSYSRIQEKLSDMGGKPTPQSSSIPRKWRNPYIQYLPNQIDQGSRGTCVGFSSAIGMTLLYYKLTGDLPAPSEVAAEQRDVELQLGCPNSKPFVHDIFNKRWKSPGYIYWASRLIGGVTAPSGSYVSAVPPALKKYGSVFETEFYTSKSMYCSGDWFPVFPNESTEIAQERIIASGSTHLIEGYAQSTNFDTICEAVYTHGFALIPINIYANYTDNGCTGNYPEIRGECVGSHAQCIVGYDLDARTLEFRQSWGKEWSNEGGISERYFDEAAGAAFIILDENETRIGEQLYATIDVKSNVPCTYVVNNETHVVENLRVSLERGVTHTITAIPLDATKVVQPSISVSITPGAETGNVEFVFTMKEIVTPPEPITKSFLAALIELIMKFIATFRKK